MFNQRDGKFFTFRPLFFTFLKNLKLLFFFLWYNDRESRWRVELAGKLQKPRGAACPPQVWNHKAAPVHRSGWEEHRKWNCTGWYCRRCVMGLKPCGKEGLT